MISAFLAVGYVAAIKFFETYVLAWWMEMFFMIGMPVIGIMWFFLFWTVFVSSSNPLRNGACNRLSDIVLVTGDDARRRLKFEIDVASLKSGAEFSLISHSRSEVSMNGTLEPKAVISSGKSAYPYYIVTFPFLGTLCKLLLFGFFWEYKGWGLGGLNFAHLFIPTLGDENDDQGKKQAIKVKFCEDGIGAEGEIPDGTITGNLVVVDKDTGNFWRERIFHCVHYDEKGASVYIVNAWRMKIFHPFRRPFPISRFTHGARWMMNKDGTISPLKNPELVIGIHPNIKHARQRPTPTFKALEQYFEVRPDLMQFCKVFDDHCITPDQIKHLTFETLFRDMKIPLGHALHMPALFQKPILLSEKPSQCLSPRADLIFPQEQVRSGEKTPPAGALTGWG